MPAKGKKVAARQSQINKRKKRQPRKLAVGQTAVAEAPLLLRKWLRRLHQEHQERQELQEGLLLLVHPLITLWAQNYCGSVSLVFPY